MLAAIGAKTVDELFDDIPEPLRLKRPLSVPPALSELELTQHASELAAADQSAATEPCFLGGGFYGLAIMTPGMWLLREREAGRWGRV